MSYDSDAPNYVALIPLRGGSKGIPNKNIRLMAGFPLCYWVLKAATECEKISQIFVSTDSEKIVEVVDSFNFGINCVIRPKLLASDTASTDEVLVDFAGKFKFQNLVTIQATSPLLTADDLQSGISLFENENLDSLLSAVRSQRFIWSSNGKALNYNPLERPRRQDFEGSLVENGAFYITSRLILEISSCRLGGKIGISEMPHETLIEIDEEDDWVPAEALLLERNVSG